MQLFLTYTPKFILKKILKSLGLKNYIYLGDRSEVFTGIEETFTGKLNHVD